MRRDIANERIPTTSHILWGGDVEVRCFGRKTGDWTLKPTEAETCRAEPGDRVPDILLRLEYLHSTFVCGRTCMPNPRMFNAEVVHAEDRTAWTDPWIGGRYLRGPFVDAVAFTACGEPQSFAIASADCPTLVLYAPEKRVMIAAHAGRDSIIDRASYGASGAWRRHVSVVDAAIEVMRAHGAAPESLHAFVVCGIGEDAFEHPADHPVHGAQNGALLRHLLQTHVREVVVDEVRGRISLAMLIRAQLRTHGLSGARIGFDGVDTFTDADDDGTPRWASHRRDGKGRNLVLVTFRSSGA